MKIFYSLSTPAFFYDQHVHGKSIPSDAVEISQKQREDFIDAFAKGGGVSSDGKGGLKVVHATPVSVITLLENAKNELRALREPMLSAVTGIGWEASEAGDTALVAEARAIRNALRDITLDPALNAAQTYEEMRAAGIAAYRRIAVGASPAFAATFKEITGA